VEAVDRSGWTALMHADQNGHADTVKALRQYTEKITTTTTTTTL
jgi:ankyrin repeat protein